MLGGEFLERLVDKKGEYKVKMTNEWERGRARRQIKPLWFPDVERVTEK